MRLEKSGPLITKRFLHCRKERHGDDPCFKGSNPLAVDDLI